MLFRSHAVRHFGHSARLVWHKDASLGDADCVIVPGGSVIALVGRSRATIYVPVDEDFGQTLGYWGIGNTTAAPAPLARAST